MKWRIAIIIIEIILFAALDVGGAGVARAESPWDMNARILGELQDAAPSRVVMDCTIGVAQNYISKGNEWIPAMAEKILIAPSLTVDPNALACGLIEWNWAQGESARQLYGLPRADLPIDIWAVSFPNRNEAFRDLFDLSPRLYRFISDDGREYGYNCVWRIPCAF